MKHETSPEYETLTIETKQYEQQLQCLTTQPDSRYEKVKIVPLSLSEMFEVQRESKDLSVRHHQETIRLPTQHDSRPA